MCVCVSCHGGFLFMLFIIMFCHVIHEGNVKLILQAMKVFFFYIPPLSRISLFLTFKYKHVRNSKLYMCVFI